MPRTMVEAAHRVKVSSSRAHQTVWLAPLKEDLTLLPAWSLAVGAPLARRRSVAGCVGGAMRLVVAVAAVSALLLASGAQGEKQAEKQAEKQTERHIFVIASNADDYGVDRCLLSSAACGTTVANAYCHSHEYAQALSFRKVERDDIAGAISASRSDDRACTGSRCGEFVAIECSR